MNRAARLALTGASAALAALLGAGAVTLADHAAGPDDPVPADDSADAGFARDMAVHHQQAVEMSYIVRDRTEDDSVRRLGYDIAQTQANQRGMMLGWLSMWKLSTYSPKPMSWMGMSMEPGSGHDGAIMPGMATDAQMEKLRTAEGKDAEILYLRLMTEHHRGGVHMAQDCVEQCEVPVERSLAQGMVESQESEIQLMADMLKKRGVKPRE